MIFCFLVVNLHCQSLGWGGATSYTFFARIYNSVPNKFHFGGQWIENKWAKWRFYLNYFTFFNVYRKNIVEDLLSAKLYDLKMHSKCLFTFVFYLFLCLTLVLVPELFLVTFWFGKQSSRNSAELCTFC